MAPALNRSWPSASAAVVVPILLTVLCHVLCIRAACPSHECYCLWGGELDCTDTDMQRIPFFTPQNDSYVVLGLGHNRLRRIRARAFENLKVDSIQMLSNRRPVEIHPRAFRGLENVLKDVTMRHNRFIGGLPRGMFRKLEKLRRADFGYNDISNISKGVFVGAHGLRSLSLVRNQLTSLEPHAFFGLINLKKLRLSENRISVVDSKAFNGLKALEELSLRDNYIRDLQPRTFKRLHNLIRLDLTNNSITAIFPLMFKGLQKLQSLQLTENNIIIIGDGAFSDMTNLKQLYLDRAKLGTVKAAMFRGLVNLTLLDLGGNSLTSLDDGTFKPLVSLRKFFVRKNRLTTVNACAFTDVVKLTDIWVDDNPILCECSLKWTSLPHTPIIYGKCASPAMVSGQQISEQEKYIVCQTDGLECRRDNQVPLNSNDVMDSWLHYWKRFF